jgi:hypothetical protein
LSRFANNTYGLSGCWHGRPPSDHSCPLGFPKWTEWRWVENLWFCNTQLSGHRFSCTCLCSVSSSFSELECFRCAPLL